METGLKMAEKKAYVFVSGFAPEVDASGIVNFLKNNNMESGCSCEKMTTKFNKKSSFKLEVPSDKKNDYLNAGLWPKGATVNHFLNIQRRVGGGFLRNRVHQQHPPPLQI